MGGDASTWTPDFGELQAAAPTWDAARPVRIAVLGDFGAGAAAGRLACGTELAARKPVDIEVDSIDAAMARVAPKLALALPEATVEVAASSLDQLHPDALYASLGIFATLADLRRRLLVNSTFAQAAAKVKALAGAAPHTRPPRRRARGSVLAPDARLSDFARLTGTAPKASPADAVDGWLRSVVGPHVVPAADASRDALVATVDAALAGAMRSVLHHPDFMAHESLWRGLDFLARRIETGPQLQLWLFDLSAEEFAADLSRPGDLSQTALYDWFVTQPSHVKGGGYALACACFEFDATPPHAELLGRAARIFEHAGAALVAGLHADAFADPKRTPHPLVAQAWSALRRLPQAAHLGMATPRFMLRHPYGRRSDPIESFAFEEFSPQAGLGSLLWGHPAIALAALAADPAGLTAGRPASVLGDLPFHHVVDADGDSVALPCTDRLYPSDVAALLGRRGLMPLLGRKGAPELRVARLVAMDGSPIELGRAGARPARVSSSVKVAIGGARRPADAGVAPAPVAAPGQDAGSGPGDPSFGAADGSSAGAEAAVAAGDAPADLDALLKSLGDSNSATPADDGAAASSVTEGMDPELAKLLNPG